MEGGKLYVFLRFLFLFLVFSYKIELGCFNRYEASLDLIGDEYEITIYSRRYQFPLDIKISFEPVR